jgi:hypothetical protein
VNCELTISLGFSKQKVNKPPYLIAQVNNNEQKRKSAQNTKANRLQIKWEAKQTPRAHTPHPGRRKALPKPEAPVKRGFRYLLELAWMEGWNCIMLASPDGLLEW